MARREPFPFVELINAADLSPQTLEAARAVMGAYEHTVAATRHPADAEHFAVETGRFLGYAHALSLLIGADYAEVLAWHSINDDEDPTADTFTLVVDDAPDEEPTVTTYTGEDGTPVVQIDTHRSARLRINLNDAPVWDGNPEADARPGAHFHDNGDPHE